jgi:hypothetical protein
LSKPFGVSASSAVAMTATANDDITNVDVEKGHRYEKSSRLKVTLMSVVRNIAIEPS